MASYNGSKSLVVVVVVVVLLLPLALAFSLWHDGVGIFSVKDNPIRIAVLHSLSGTMAESEAPLVDIILMGVDEINKQGGLLGRRLEAIVVDGRSDDQHFAREAERLIVEEKVDVIFGCWTSSCRKAVKLVVERHNHLLFYPIQYEGLEQSDNIVYTGAAPNQQIIPAVNWALKKFGRRVYLLGSDYIFPRTANFIIRDIVKIKNSEVVAERYLSLGSSDFDDVIEEIGRLRPDVIFNSINGDSNHHFFKRWRQAGLDDIPVVSFSVAEAELARMPAARINTHFAVWNYFQSIDSPVNRDFVARVKKRLGPDQVVGDPMEASYIGLKIWSQAVLLAESTDPVQVINAVDDQGFNAPEGIVSIDSSNHHLRKFVRVGQARSDGQFDIIWRSTYAIRPAPFPVYRNRNEWDEIIERLSQDGAK